MDPVPDVVADAVADAAVSAATLPLPSVPTVSTAADVFELLQTQTATPTQTQASTALPSTNASAGVDGADGGEHSAEVGAGEQGAGPATEAPPGAAGGAGTSPTA